MKYQISEDMPMDQALQDVNWITKELFGTPDDPVLPEFVAEDEEYASLISTDNLLKASGPAEEEGRGLYRKHCVICHGMTGDGRGVSASIQNPYPRDYRKGVFKFTSTPRGKKPVREDIAKLIRGGIEGTSMAKIPALSEADVQALTDYVIYLSWRGELERAMLDESVLSGDYDFEAGDRIIVPEDRELVIPEGIPDEQAEELEERKEYFEDGWGFALDVAEDIAGSWLDAPDHVVEIPDAPTDIPVTNSFEEFEAMMQSDQAEKLAASVQRGQEVFLGKTASCSKCHGNTGKGDGQTTDYDEWTKDWTLKAGLKPENQEALIPLLARGALPPLNAKPRNFESGAFHGGETANDLYLRITQGIDGTPMPAATFVEGDFEPQDVWHLINFIRSREAEAKQASESTGEKESAEPAPSA